MVAGRLLGVAALVALILLEPCRAAEAERAERAGSSASSERAYGKAADKGIMDFVRLRGSGTGGRACTSREAPPRAPNAVRRSRSSRSGA